MCSRIQDSCVRAFNYCEPLRVVSNYARIQVKSTWNFAQVCNVCNSSAVSTWKCVQKSASTNRLCTKVCKLNRVMCNVCNISVESAWNDVQMCASVDTWSYMQVWIVCKVCNSSALMTLGIVCKLH